ncbi:MULTISPECIES: ATP-dependent helicase HrpB [Brucella]|uniref:ATP-dependent helicase n=1 Tax=Ochrobactrum soli TaxID=2448455 RepID=A0A2P9HJJ9_9HYPH|nr:MULTISPECIES: ATP-dependent helicase HrpB [Brucella]RRD27863.1 ATP-dependent helicase HrpB [Brucellaceae bacterium VT-16-1752]WHT41281.1 ATP-dependent helicase HrpB [Ochrobactrum sp. SSR]MDX4075427.1 ATP-dependent helicase HrpB [Brucella sp. NBRC 113783]WHS32231.1 ATP-dependent helicase HrpB [Brucella sp. NM4]SPL64278.1 ATP-dependent helicase [[Ochrobactrum] soli]
MTRLPDLPVTRILPQLVAAMDTHASAVLVAPPGAGKTTLVPIHMLDAQWRGDGMIVLLEPRRLAARAAARRMAELLGEEPGETVGYRMRLESKVSGRTKILVVTEGVFARMILDNPDLKGVAAVLFDEFHERSLDADFGLALALDVQAALRDDLKILVMSATLDGARVAALLGDAPVIESEGRAFPVDIRYRERKADERVEDAMARSIRDALVDETGSILAFLPGQGEIERTVRLLEDRVPAHVILAPLYGAMEGRDQDAAIKPAPEGRRKVVLATSIAETSITIDGVRVVIDSGLARLPKYEPATGLTRLETVRTSRASADQRAGRAGRTEPGMAIRLWHQGQTASLPAFSPPEILEADLSGLVLDSAAWGVTDPATLAFLDAPPKPALNEARALLRRLGALDEAGRLTPDGEAMRQLALPARLAHMVAEAGKRGEVLKAAELAVLLTERGLGGNETDLDTRFSRFRNDRSDRAQRAKGLAKRLAANVPNQGAPAGSGIGRMLIDAYPDRIARARGQTGQFLLANGRGGEVDSAISLSRAPWLVVADMSGKAGRARVLSAAEVSEAEIRLALGERIESGRQVVYDPEKNALRAREAVRIGAIALSEKPLAAPSGSAADEGVIAALREHGLGILPWGKEAEILRRRLGWLYRGLGDPWPSMDDEHLLETLEDWLLPFLTGEAQLDRIPGHVLKNGLMSLVPFDLQRSVDQLAPTHFTVPTGSHIPIHYDAEEPVLAVRVQELFGLGVHPSIANGKVPLLLELLSPAHRPIQITRDLPGFWKGSWADVRSDMRGRYPRHVWPEDPANAEATRRAKPRGT